MSHGLVSSLPDPAAPVPEPRRNFVIRVAAFVIGGIVSLVPALAGAVFFLDPLRSRGRSVEATKKNVPPAGLEGYTKLGGVDAGSISKTPTLVKVIQDRFDAWNFFPQEPVGAVYLYKNDAGAVIAYNAACPHLGCIVDYKGGGFACPCHNSSFTLAGERNNQIPPRGMDTLDVKEVENAVWVRFQNFRAGEPHKIPKV